MTDGKPRPKRLAEFAETDAILRLLNHVKQRPAKEDGGRRTEDGEPKTESDLPLSSDSVLPPPSSVLPAEPPAQAFIGDEVGQPVDLTPPPLPATISDLESTIPNPQSAIDDPAGPPVLQQTSPVLDFEPDRLTTAMPMHAFVEWFSGGPAGAAKTEDGGRRMESELPISSDSVRRPPPSDHIIEPVPRPISALTFGELIARMNWRNRPEDVQPLPLIGEPEPAGYGESVEGILAAFNWDDE